MKKNNRVFTFSIILVLCFAVFFCRGASAENVLKLPDDLKVIEERAFFEDESLDVVELPDHIEKIGKLAFAQSSITAVNLPDSLTEIADDAFDSCWNVSFTANRNTYAYSWLEKWLAGEIPESPANAFRFSSNGDGTCILTGYSGQGSRVRIPDQDAQGNTVVGIGDYAFYNCQKLMRVILPESIVSIGTVAFYGCDHLISINIPDSVTAVGDSAFYLCEAIRYANRNSEGAKALGRAGYSFREPESKYDLRYVYTDGLMPGLEILGADKDLITVEIPTGVTGIGGDAFSGCNSLTEITIPDTVTSFGEYAFYNCTSLESIMIPDGLNCVSSYSFYGCNAIRYAHIGSEGAKTLSRDAYTSFRVPGGNCDLLYTFDSNKEITGLLAIGGDQTVASITIPDGVTGIRQSAFSHFNNLMNVTIPESVTSIDSRAFEYCPLTSITIPGSVKTIGYEAFSHSGVRSVILQEGVESISNRGFYCCESMESIILPKSLKIINQMAFYQCRSLTEISIPENVTEIGISAFSQCSCLKRIKNMAGVTSIGADAFYRCENLERIILPEGLTSVGRTAFYGCGSMIEITIPDSLNSIGSRVFEDCGAVRYANIGSDGAKTISRASLSFRVPDGNCDLIYRYNNDDAITDLEACGADRNAISVTIPEGVTSIGSGAFRGYSALERIIIPDGVMTIGNNAFGSCSNLENVTLPDGLTGIGSHAFEKCSHLKRIIIPGSVNSIGEYAFQDCKKLENVTIMEGVTEMGEYTFYDCTSLTGVILPNSLSFISSGAFNSCSSLVNITLPDSLSAINNAAFGFCSNLQSISIPSGVTSIGRSAFYECERLSVIMIPQWVESIGDYAFGSCRLREIYCVPDTYAWGWFIDYGYLPERTLFPWNGTPVESASISVTPSEAIVAAGCSKRFTATILPVQAQGRGVTWSVINESGTAQIDQTGRFTALTPGTVTVRATAKDDAEIYGEANVTIVTLEGAFSDEPIVIALGSSLVPDATVTSADAPVHRVTLTINGWDGDGSASNRYRTRVFEEANLNTVSLTDQNWANDYVLDTAQAPLNTPGEYTVNLWADLEEDGGVKLDSQTLYVGWTGYVQTPQIDTYPSAYSTIPNGYVVDQDPVIVVLEEGDRYYIDMILTAGGHAQRWVDKRWIKAEPWELRKLDGPVITYPSADQEAVQMDNMTVQWEPVEGTAYYVISLRELDTDSLLICHNNMHAETSAELQASYFIPGMTYRVAVGAVPAGEESTSEYVGWSERIFSIQEEDAPEKAAVCGEVYELTTEVGVRALKLMTRDNITVTGENTDDLPKVPLADCTVQITKLALNNNEIVATVKTDENGVWKCNNLIYDEVYQINFSKEGKIFYQSIFPHQATGMNDQVESAYCYDSSLDMPAQLLRIEYDGTISQLSQGLYAEYFVYNEWFSAEPDIFMTAENKRAENTVPNVDFSWTQEAVQLTVQGLDYGKPKVTHSELKVKAFNNEESGLDPVLYVPVKFGVKLNGYLCVDMSVTEDNVDDTVSLRVRGDNGVWLKLERNEYDKPYAKDWGWGSNNQAELSDRVAVGTPYKLEIDHYSNGGEAKLILEYNPWPKSSANFKNGWKTVPSEWLFQGERTVRITGNSSIQTLYAMRLDAASTSINSFCHKTWKELLGDMVSTYIGGPIDSHISGYLGLGNDYISGSEKVVTQIRKRIINKIKKTVKDTLISSLCAALTDELAGDVTEKNFFTVLWENIADELNTSVTSIIPQNFSSLSSDLEKYLVVRQFLENKKEMDGFTEKLERINNLLSFNDIDHNKEGYKLNPDATVESLLYADGDTKNNIEDMEGLLEGSGDAEKLVDFADKAYHLIKDLEKDADRARATIQLLYNENGISWFDGTVELAARYNSYSITGASAFEKMLNMQVNGNNDRDKLQNLLEHHLPYMTGAQCASLLAANQNVSLDHMLYKELLVLTLDAAKGVYKSLLK